MKMQEFADVFHGPVRDYFGIAMSLIILVLPIYYLWNFFASFRRTSANSHWPPVACLGLWLLQWPFVILGAAGCMGGGCGGLVINVAEIICMMAYNLAPPYWLWRRTRAHLRRHSSNSK